MYYPKSKILENQYTNGKEFVLSTSKNEYIGWYYITSENKIYSGKNATVGPSVPLLNYNEYNKIQPVQNKLYNFELLVKIF